MIGHKMGSVEYAAVRLSKTTERNFEDDIEALSSSRVPSTCTP